MRTKIAMVVAGVLIGVAAFSPAAMASGGSSTGGGGGISSGGSAGGSTGGGGGGGGSTGGGGGTTAGGNTGGKTEPCVKVNSFTANGTQSTVTSGANLAAALTVSTCSGGAKGFTVTMTATDPSGAVVLSDSSSWVPSGSIPYSRFVQTDNTAFATTYTVSMSVVNTETGVNDATSIITAATPAVRIPGCATIASLSGREGLIGSMNALWAFYAVSNCGGSDTFDLTVTGTGTSGNIISAPDQMVIAGGSAANGAHDFDPAPVDTYTLTLTVTEHNTGQVLATASAAV